MGMAASQVRFLSLQNRKNTIGLNLMTLSNRKTALSRDMNRVAAEYNNAMNQKVLKWSNNSGVTYHDIDYDSLMKPNELNETLPYIVTDAQGRVVVDDNNIVFDGKDTGVSYRQLATMISTYSGVDPDTSLALYNNTDRVSGLTGAPVTRVNEKITDIGKAQSGQASSEEYDIMSSFDNYNFMNSMRYDLMTKLGLITENDKTEFTNLLEELYGDPDIFNKGGNDYSGILKAFDANRTKATADYDDYGKIFGSLGTDPKDPEAFVLVGGSAMGNLALAKAYQKEYQAYLKTDLVHDLLVDKKQKIATTTAGSGNELDNSNTTAESQYEYHEMENTGISNRMLSFLESKNLAKKDGNTYNLTVSGILNNLGFYDAEGTAKNYNDILYNRTQKNSENKDVTIVQGDLHYDKDNNAAFDYSVDATTWSGNWGNLYDMDGGLNGVLSYDRDGDGYITGSDYVGNTNNSTTGMSILINSDREYSGHGGFDDLDEGLQYILDTLVNSLKQIPNIDENGLAYANKKTFELYKTSNSMRENTNGDKHTHTARERAAGVAKDTFGFGTCDDFGDKDPAYLNMTNLINAFVTFYEMYEAVGGNEDLINDGSTGNKVYGAEFSALTDYYNASIVKDLKNSNNPLAQYLKDFKPDTFPPTGTYNQNSEVIYTKADGSKIKVYGKSDGGTGFNSISKIEYLSDDGKEVEEAFEYTGDPNGNKTLKHTIYKGDAEGKNYKKYATVEYTYNNNNNGTSGATIKFENVQSVTIPEDPSDEKSKTHSYNLNTITIDNDGQVQEVKNGNTNVDLENLKTKEIAYYIIDPNSATKEADENYKYKLIVGHKTVEKSTFAATITTKPADLYGDKFDKLVQSCQDRVNQLMTELNRKYAALESRGMDYFDAIFKMIAENGWVYDENVNNPTKKEDSKNYLNAKLQNNMYFITEVDTLDGQDFNYATKLAMNVSKVFQVYDTDAQNVALSKYESEKADITAKEKVIDIRMNKLEAEQDAISTELDSIKQIIKDNVDKTFKIFT